MSIPAGVQPPPPVVDLLLFFFSCLGVRPAAGGGEGREGRHYENTVKTLSSCKAKVHQQPSPFQQNFDVFPPSSYLRKNTHPTSPRVCIQQAAKVAQEELLRRERIERAHSIRSEAIAKGREAKEVRNPGTPRMYSVTFFLLQLWRFLFSFPH